jgi:trk system potassium uptake protein TrkA
MRVVIVGATALGVFTARRLVEGRHDVVVIDRDRAALDRLGDDLDCGMIHGDGTLPSTLRSAAGDAPDALLALTNHDEDNILAALVARSIGFSRVAPKIVNGELGPICVELDLGEAIFADESIAGDIVGRLQKKRAIDEALGLGDGWEIVQIVAGPDHEGPASSLPLPAGVTLLTIKREGAVSRARDDTEIAEGDRLTLLAHEDDQKALVKAFGDARPSD